jgi:hypothetical protein
LRETSQADVFSFGCLTNCKSPEGAYYNSVEFQSGGFGGRIRFRIGNTTIPTVIARPANNHITAAVASPDQRRL